MISYVFNSLIWSLVGGAAGFKFGQLYRDNAEMRRKLDMPEHSTLEIETSSKRPEATKRHRPSGQQIIAIIVIAMSVITVISGVFYSRRLNMISECQTAYLQSYTDALQARDAISAKSRSDLRGYVVAAEDLWRGFIKSAPQPGAQPTAEQRTASLAILDQYFKKADAYLASIDAVNKARVVYPIPDNICGVPSAGR